jgi:hypothetical protein
VYGLTGRSTVLVVACDLCLISSITELSFDFAEPILAAGIARRRRPPAKPTIVRKSKGRPCLAFDGWT